ncbi:hypothetical protein GEV33_013211 [Tenebrio molitor]|uniref:Uncharacterized protein n=1 Tax=Tenebrio molitor TaxID=7067 RepID=A0A8J6H8X5_TENMO|nr:hypothetical protein GEV33_013211 [Tenebrio molitor]
MNSSRLIGHKDKFALDTYFRSPKSVPELTTWDSSAARAAIHSHSSGPFLPTHSVLAAVRVGSSGAGLGPPDSSGDGILTSGTRVGLHPRPLCLTPYTERVGWYVRVSGASRRLRSAKPGTVMAIRRRKELRAPDFPRTLHEIIDREMAHENTHVFPQTGKFSDTFLHKSPIIGFPRDENNVNVDGDRSVRLIAAGILRRAAPTNKHFLIHPDKMRANRISHVNSRPIAGGF